MSSVSELSERLNVFLKVKKVRISAAICRILKELILVTIIKNTGLGSPKCPEINFLQPEVFAYITDSRLLPSGKKVIGR